MRLLFTNSHKTRTENSHLPYQKANKPKIIRKIVTDMRFWFSPQNKKRTNVNDNEQWKVLLYCVIPHWLFSVCWRGWNEIFVWLIYRQKSMWKLITLTFIGIDSRQADNIMWLIYEIGEVWCARWADWYSIVFLEMSHLISFMTIDWQTMTGGFL